MGSAVLSVKHGFTPPSGCTWMYTLGLRVAGKRSAMYTPGLRASAAHSHDRQVVQRTVHELSEN